jgi:hypothetical protein
VHARGITLIEVLSCLSILMGASTGALLAAARKLPLPIVLFVAPLGGAIGALGMFVVGGSILLQILFAIERVWPRFPPCPCGGCRQHDWCRLHDVPGHHVTRCRHHFVLSDPCQFPLHAWQLDAQDVPILIYRRTKWGRWEHVGQVPLPCVYR